MQSLYPDNLRFARRIMWAYVLTGLAVFALMLVLGLAMRLEQAGRLSFNPGLFYSMMTLHGAGMLTAIALASMGILWYLMRLEGDLDERVGLWAYALFVVGVLSVLISVFPGRFGAGWTFLYPLPFVGAYWPSWATGAFLIGVMLVTIGFAVWCAQMVGFTLRRYGGLRNAIGWDLVIHPKAYAASGKEPPPPQGIAALVAGIDGLITAAAGTLIGIGLIAHWLAPSVQLDPLWAKNITYLFGHAFANLTIYMAVGAVYVGIARYAQREYRTSNVLALAWWGTLLFIIIAYFHHLYMDFAQWRALQFIGEAASYLATLPVATVTVFGSLLLMYRSQFRWTLGSLFLFTGLIGWIVGGIGAVLDATIPFNLNLHNTLWVPAHFHTYLLEGVLLFVLGWVFMLLEERAGTVSSLALRWLAGLGIFGGGAVFLVGFYIAGAAGVPRRYAIEPAPGPDIAWWSSIGALIFIAGLAVAVIEGLRLRAKRSQR